MKFKRYIALTLAAIMFVYVSPLAANANGKTDYTITNPYEGVDFDTYYQYKADLHSHTSLSDGKYTQPEMVERHYELGFDILAISDHGTTSQSYTYQPYTDVMKIWATIKNGKPRGEMISENGTAANGNSYRVFKENGDEYYVQTLPDGSQGQNMLRVPFANEQNPTSFNNAHVNSWFIDYGNNTIGGTSNYYKVISDVDKLGGLCVINHPGEYSGARNEIYEANSYDMSDPVYKYKAQMFGSLLKDYKACIGIDINSKGDYRTRFDRKLWDILLQDVVPTGRNVFAIATTDAHNIDVVDSGYTLILMKENNSENIKNAIKNGNFFAASKCVGNVNEIKQYRNEIDADKYSEFIAVLDEVIAQAEAEIDSGNTQSTKFKALDGSPAPKITNVVVNNDNDTISLKVENAATVHWIANGKVIATGDTIVLNEHSNEIGSYVRAEAFGEGGVIYTQAFTLDYDGAPKASENHFVNYSRIITFICDAPVKLLAFILPLKLIGKFIDLL